LYETDIFGFNIYAVIGLMTYFGQPE